MESMSIRQLMDPRNRGVFQVIQDHLTVTGELNTINAAEFVRQLGRHYNDHGLTLSVELAYKHREVFIATNFVKPTKYQLQAARDGFLSFPCQRIFDKLIPSRQNATQYAGGVQMVDGHPAIDESNKFRPVWYDPGSLAEYFYEFSANVSRTLGIFDDSIDRHQVEIKDNTADIKKLYKALEATNQQVSANKSGLDGFRRDVGALERDVRKLSRKNFVHDTLQLVTAGIALLVLWLMITLIISPAVRHSFNDGVYQIFAIVAGFWWAGAR
ncbi:MAG: hypothetical protein M1836_001763 [Candelina mexicana]|nr:MAG: hypothetical protein M1836_001763 [Candelina mexicana]